MNVVTLLSTTSENELYCALAVSADYLDILLDLPYLCNKTENDCCKSLLFLFRGFKDAALRTSAYFNGDFSRCDSNAARKFLASSLKARALVSLIFSFTSLGACIQAAMYYIKSTSAKVHK